MVYSGSALYKMTVYFVEEKKIYINIGAWVKVFRIVPEFWIFRISKVQDFGNFELSPM